MILKLKDGDVKIELFEDVAPNHVKRIKDLANSGKYDNVVFHRVIDGFMIQGGGFEPGMNQKQTRGTVENEADNGLKNDRGTIAMARTSDPHSASSQFFINHKDNERLDWTPFKPGYTVFGKVVTGMRVVDYIASTPTGDAIATLEKGQAPLRNVPLEPIIIERISLVNP